MAASNAAWDIAMASSFGAGLSEELVLNCLTWLPGAPAHFIISTSCRNFRLASAADDLWICRLTQDFPRVCLQGKAPGSFRGMYKLLTKAYDRHYRATCSDRDGKGRPESWYRLMAARAEPLPVHQGPSQLHIQHARISLPQLSSCARAAAAAARRRNGQPQRLVEVPEGILHQLIADRRQESQIIAAVLEADGGVSRAVAAFEMTIGTFAGARGLANRRLIDLFDTKGACCGHCEHASISSGSIPLHPQVSSSGNADVTEQRSSDESVPLQFD